MIAVFTLILIAGAGLPIVTDGVLGAIVVLLNTGPAGINGIIAGVEVAGCPAVGIAVVVR